MCDVVGSLGNIAFCPNTVRIPQLLSIGHSIPVTVQLTQCHAPLNRDTEMVAMNSLFILVNQDFLSFVFQSR